MKKKKMLTAILILTMVMSVSIGVSAKEIESVSDYLNNEICKFKKENNLFRQNY